jgi:hypothetical protein
LLSIIVAGAPIALRPKLVFQEWRTQLLNTGVLALAGVIITAAAALLSQWIYGYFSLKHKRTELWFTRKVDSYQRLLNVAAVFAADPSKTENYLPFIGALDAATIVASPRVSDLLINPSADGLSVNAQRLRASETPEELKQIQVTKWYDAMKRVSEAMREDVAGVIVGGQG